MSAYEITVSVTPLCSSCGAELGSGLTEARTTGHPVDRDNPFERTERRVFFPPCDKCFVFRPNVAELAEAMRNIRRRASDAEARGTLMRGALGNIREDADAALAKFGEG